MSRAKDLWLSIKYIFATFTVFFGALMLSTVIMVGCGNISKGAAVVEKGAAIIEEGAATVEEGAVKVDANSKILSELIKTTNSLTNQIQEIKEMTQTNNYGFMSGGAPWLFAVIMAIFWYNQRNKYVSKEREAREKTIQLSSKEEQIKGLEQTVDALNHKITIKSIMEGTHEKQQKKG